MSKKLKPGAVRITPKQKLALANKILLDGTLTLAARVVGWYIADHINIKRGYAWPPQEDIAKDLSIDERTVRRATKELASYFVIDRSRRQHEYRIATPDNLSGIASPDISPIPDIFAPIPDTDVPPSFLHPTNSALAAARATPIDIGVKLNRQQRMTIFERKLKSETATDEEAEACGTLCKQVCSDPHATDAEFYQAYRLLENYELDPPKKPQPMERKR